MFHPANLPAAPEEVEVLDCFDVEFQEGIEAHEVIESVLWLRGERQDIPSIDGEIPQRYDLDRLEVVGSRMVLLEEDPETPEPRFAPIPIPRPSPISISKFRLAMSLWTRRPTSRAPRSRGNRWFAALRRSRHGARTREGGSEQNEGVLELRMQCNIKTSRTSTYATNMSEKH